MPIIAGTMAALALTLNVPNSAAPLPSNSYIVNVTVTDGEGSSPTLPADRFAYDPVPHGAWLGLDGNSDSSWTGEIGDFTAHHIVYDRGGGPGIEWQAGELLKEGGKLYSWGFTVAAPAAPAQSASR